MIFITALRGDDVTNNRCFGYKKTLSDATYSVAINEGSMGECLYDYLVLESFEPGIHPIALEMGWYKWNDDTSGWTECSKPKQLEGIVNFAIG